jgi:hypothetical protein
MVCSDARTVCGEGRDACSGGRLACSDRRYACRDGRTIGSCVATVGARVSTIGGRVAMIGTHAPMFATHRGMIPTRGKISVARGSGRLLVGSAIFRHAAICPRDVHELMIVLLPVPPTASGSPVIDAELWKNILEMFVNGARTGLENFGDLLTGFAVRNPIQHFALARRQARPRHSVFPVAVAFARLLWRDR